MAKRKEQSVLAFDKKWIIFYFHVSKCRLKDAVERFSSGNYLSKIAKSNKKYGVKEYDSMVDK